MDFDAIGPIGEVEIITIGNSIREIGRLRRVYEPGRWRKLEGVALIRLSDGLVSQAELHWYEAHGIGKKEMNIQRLLKD